MNNLTCKMFRAITSLFVIQMGDMFGMKCIKVFSRGAFFPNLRYALWNSSINVQSKFLCKKYIFSRIELGKERLYVRFPAKSKIRNECTCVTPFRKLDLVGVIYSRNRLQQIVYL